MEVAICHTMKGDAILKDCFPLVECDRKKQILLELHSELTKTAAVSSSVTVSLSATFTQKLLESIEGYVQSSDHAMGLVADLRVLQRQQLQRQSWMHNFVNCKFQHIDTDTQPSGTSAAAGPKGKKKPSSVAAPNDEQDKQATNAPFFDNLPLDVYPFAKHLMPSFSVQ